MNIKKLITAASLSAVALPSFALVPGTAEEGNWPRLNIYGPGVSSMDKQLNWLKKNNIGQLGALDTFTS